MDPASQLALTTAITTLATEVGKDLVSEGSKRAWAGIKSLFGWKSDPAPAEVEAECRRRLPADEALAQQALVLITQSNDQRVQQLVGSIRAQKVVVAHKIDTLNM